MQITRLYGTNVAIVDNGMTVVGREVFGNTGARVNEVATAEVLAALDATPNIPRAAFMLWKALGHYGSGVEVDDVPPTGGLISVEVDDVAYTLTVTG